MVDYADPADIAGYAYHLQQRNGRAAKDMAIVQGITGNAGVYRRLHLAL